MSFDNPTSCIKVTKQLCRHTSAIWVCTCRKNMYTSKDNTTILFSLITGFCSILATYMVQSTECLLTCNYLRYHTSHLYEYATSLCWLLKCIASWCVCIMNTIYLQDDGYTYTSSYSKWAKREGNHCLLFSNITHVAHLVD